MKKRKPRVGSAEWNALALAREAASQKKKKMLHSRHRREPTRDDSYFQSNIRRLEKIIEYVDDRIGENEGDDVYDDFDTES